MKNRKLFIYVHYSNTNKYSPCEKEKFPTVELPMEVFGHFKAYSVRRKLDPLSPPNLTINGQKTFIF